MISAIRSEFRKFFTTRLWWGMAIAIFGVTFAGQDPTKDEISKAKAAAPTWKNYPA